MKKHFLLLSLCIFMTALKAVAQYSGSFVVQGDWGKYYPVIFQDPSWTSNKESEFDLGRSSVHQDGNWRGSLIAKFKYHTTNWGNGSNFIDANVRQFNPGNTNAFVAGWVDGTYGNSNSVIVVWLQGGSTTYYFNSPSNITPVVYDGVANALPYQVTNGPAYTYKTTIDNYVNFDGTSSGGTAYFTGTTTDNYFAGYVGIGTSDPDQLLTVNGTIHAKQVNIDLNIQAPDYVFEKSYKLKPLSAVEKYIISNKHLPEIPPAKTMEKDGVNVNELNMKLLQKVEELTLYLIEKDKQQQQQEEQIRQLKKRLNKLEKQPATK